MELNKIILSILHWQFGIHHLNIDVDYMYFNCVVDNLSCEFEIHKESKFIDNHIEYVKYFFYNYYDDPEDIGVQIIYHAN